MTKIKSYTQAVEELENILLSLEESENVDMDEITGKVKRASELMAYCKKKLHQLDEDLEKIISESVEE